MGVNINNNRKLQQPKCIWIERTQHRHSTIAIHCFVFRRFADDDDALLWLPLRLPICLRQSAKVTAVRFPLKSKRWCYLWLIFSVNFLALTHSTHTHWHRATAESNISSFLIFNFTPHLPFLDKFHFSFFVSFIPAFFPFRLPQNMKFSFENRRDCHQITSSTSHCLIRLGTLSMRAYPHSNRLNRLNMRANYKLLFLEIRTKSQCVCGYGAQWQWRSGTAQHNFNNKSKYILSNVCSSIQAIAPRFPLANHTEMHEKWPNNPVRERGK